MRAAVRIPGTEGVYYGWVVVAATFLVLFLGFGTAYSFAAFFEPLRDEFDADRGDISLVFAITACLYFLLGAASGPIADRVGPKRVVVGGMLACSLGLFLASAAQELWQVYVTYCLGVGLGVGFSYVPAVGTIQRWFIRQRGLASGLAVAGVGLGTLAFPPFAALLIDFSDWRTTYLVLASLTLVAGVAAGRFIEHSPQRKGLLPDGQREPQVAASAAPPPRGLAVREALRTRTFVLLYVSGAATSLALFIPFVHLAPYAQDEGLANVTGSLLVGLIGAGSAAGRLFLGTVADRVGRKQSLAGTYAGMGLAMLWWLAASDFWSLAVFAVLFGAFYGGFVALMPALTADYFGSRHAGTIIGLLYTSAAAGALFGPTLAGVVYDLEGSYTVPILFGVGANAGALACVAFLRNPRAGAIRA